MRVSALLTLLLMLLGGAAAANSNVRPPVLADDAVRQVVVVDPASDLWRAVRQREGPAVGTTQARNVAAGQLINPAGEEWRQFRVQQLIPIAGWLLAGAAAAVLLLFAVRPSVPYAGGPSDRWLERFNAAKRVGHWVMAIVMLLLALTGLVLLFGRYAFLPWLGKDNFGAFAALSKQVHDLLGPVFVAALLVFVVQFVRRNLPARGDLGWLLRLGGLFSRGHLPAGFFNAGEKTLFWLVTLLGVALSVSGLVLLLQNLEPGRDTQQLALLAHAAAAVGLTAVVFGHIYMAFSTKGALQGMISGRVDANWARDHHRLWYEEAERQGLVQRGETESTANPAARGEATGQA